MAHARCYLEGRQRSGLLDLPTSSEILVARHYRLLPLVHFLAIIKQNSCRYQLSAALPAQRRRNGRSGDKNGALRAAANRQGAPGLSRSGKLAMSCSRKTVIMPGYQVDIFWPLRLSQMAVFHAMYETCMSCQSHRCGRILFTISCLWVVKFLQCLVRSYVPQVSKLRPGYRP